MTAQEHTPSAPAGGADALLASLVERARGGDMQAWARLYQDHWARLLRHVGYLTGDAATAEDLVQETFAQGLAATAPDPAELERRRGPIDGAGRIHCGRPARRSRRFCVLLCGFRPNALEV